MTTTTQTRLVKTLQSRFAGYTKTTHVAYTGRRSFEVYAIVRFDSGSHFRSEPKAFGSVVAAVRFAAAIFANP